MKKLIQLAFARPAIAVFFFVLGVALVSNYVSGRPVLIGVVYNLNDPKSVSELEYVLPETAKAVREEIVQDSSGRVFLYISTVEDPE
jgi:hypothetical protein